MMSLVSARSMFAAESGSFTWTFSGALIQVNIPYSLISRLKAEVSRSRLKSMLEVEIGGILLGQRVGSSSLIEIRDCVLVAPSPHPSGFYVLNLAELDRMRQADATLSVIGYFRTQSKGIPRLRLEELELVRKHFSDPSNVVLLIQTSVEPNNAGFLSWKKDVFLPYSFQEFPLDAGLLRRGIKAPLLPKMNNMTVGWMPQQKGVKRESRLGLRLGTMLVLGASLLAAGLSTFVLRERWQPVTAIGVDHQASSPALVLELQRQPGGIEVRWNPRGFPIDSVLRGSLAIREGDQKTQSTIALDREQLATGHLYYQSPSQFLEFRLEVVNGAGAIAKGSVIALSSRSTPDPSAQAQPANPPDHVPMRMAQLISGIGVETTHANPKSMGVPHIYVPKPVSKSADPSNIPVLDDSVTDPAASLIANVASPPEVPGRGFFTPSSLPTLPVSTHTPNSAALENSSGQRLVPRVANASTTPLSRPNPPLLHPPLPIRKVQPVLPPAIAAQMQASMEIDVVIATQIDVAGRVVKAEVLDRAPGSLSALQAQLEIAAVDAVKQWRFEPARSGNVAVPSDHVITFRFQKH